MTTHHTPNKVRVPIRPSTPVTSGIATRSVIRKNNTSSNDTNDVKHPTTATLEGVVKYERRGRIAHITLNRAHALNAISPTMPAELRRAVEMAERDDAVHVVVLTGSGRSFCSGYDLRMFAEGSSDGGGRIDAHEGGVGGTIWDPIVDYRMMKRNTDDFMSLWRCCKPTVCKVRGHAVAGGSDIALCCDLIVMEENAVIGYPPVRVWGIPTTSMWCVRLGAERAKMMMFTGKLITGIEAERIGLVSAAVPDRDLDGFVSRLATQIAGVPLNQLAMCKTVVNASVEGKVHSTQRLATLFDGIARHSPEGRYFQDRSREVGFKQAVQERDDVEGVVVPQGISHRNYRFEDIGNSARL